MIQQETPYEYGDEKPGMAFRTAEAEECEPVIVNGVVMSLRSYRRLTDSVGE
jgi:hypothetical protein